MLALADETLGSFLTRWAWNQGEAPAAFTHRLGLGYFVWRQDLDRGLSPAMLSTVAGAAGVEVRTIQEMTYRMWLTQACVPVRMGGYQAWLAPIGLYHRRRMRFGQLFCPLCLKEDAQRHLHLGWRFSFSWICTKHRVSLMDSCPCCGMPFAPYRDDALMLGRCDRCAFPLYSSKPASCSAYQTALQEYVDVLWHQAIDGEPLPLARVYLAISKVAKSSPDFAHAGEPWGYWRVIERGQLLETVLAQEKGRTYSGRERSCVQRLYATMTASPKARQRGCTLIPKDPQLRAQKLLRMAMCLTPRRLTASRVRKHER